MRSIRRVSMQWLMVMLAGLGSLPAVADEIADLARIHREIGYVMALVDEVREKTRPAADATARFRYDALTSRLEALQRDIARHIEWEQTRPKLERFRVQ